MFPFVACAFLEYSLITIDFIAAIFAIIALVLISEPKKPEFEFQMNGDILGVFSAIFAALTIIFMRKA
jgi:drug/metabolite transporter (DMT)-like permease